MLKTKERLPFAVKAYIDEEFENSNLLYSVDISDFLRLTERMQEKVPREGVLVYESSQMK